MSGSSFVKTLGLEELDQWLEGLGLFQGSSEGEGGAHIQDKLKDGILLCQLVNLIRPGSVEEIKPKRSSGDAEENILRFLKACTSLGIKKIFRPSDLLAEGRDFNSVMVTIQLLYNVAVDVGLGLKVPSKSPDPQPENGFSPSESTGGEEEEGAGEEPAVKLYAKAVYAFSGTNEDELQFEKGDLVKVTNIVEGGWWEGVCNGNVGWFPGNYVEEIAKDAMGGLPSAEDDVHHYHRLVVQDILESERAYVKDLNALLSTYLSPLAATNVVSQKEVEQLTGNLPDLTRWQQTFLKELEDCSRLPVTKQNMGAVFFSRAREIEGLYCTYCANHPKAVAVLTENSDKLSAFMESKGAASPGMLTLTSNLSKPFRRLEKYPILLKELQRHLSEGHADTESVNQSIDAYKTVLTQTQEIRKRKEMEHEMLSNPVKGFNGTCLNELGDCRCVIVAQQALNSEEVDEVYFLVFPNSFVILAVGSSLSGYELRNNFSLGAMTLKKGQHSDQWPWPVEVQHRQETIHASLASEADQRLLADAVAGGGGAPPPRTAVPPGTKALSHADSAQIFRTAYHTRNTRRSTVNIQRPLHWGFKSLRPAPPLKTQQLIGLRERDKSPKSAKKFNYPNVKKKRASKHMEELLAMAGNLKGPVENKPGDNAILRVIEAYCASGGRGGAIHSDQPVTYINPKKASQPSSRGPSSSSTLDDGSVSDVKDHHRLKATTLPHSRSKGQNSPKNFSRPADLPGFPYRPPSPILTGGHDRSTWMGASLGGGGAQGASSSGKSAPSKRSLFRRRAETIVTAGGRGRDSKTVVAMLEGQVLKLASEIARVQETLQVEETAHKELSNKVNFLTDRLEVIAAYKHQ